MLANPEELIENDFTGNGHGAYIQQVGNANELSLLQEQIGAEGNLAKVLQQGDANAVFITQAGAANQLILLQKGELNEFDLIANGHENTTFAIQNGTQNTIVQRLIQSNRIHSELIQIGNNNLIITELQGINNRGLRIRQEGNGMKAIVREIGN